jgi:hypothetical protein
MACRARSRNTGTISRITRALLTASKRGCSAAIALGVGGGTRAFAQHVERIARLSCRMTLHAVERGLDGLSEHEMAAHQPHRLTRRRAHRGRAKTPRQSPDGTLRRLAGPNHARRGAERPRRGVDEEGAGARFVVDEIALAELVLDEAVGGVRIGHAQQRFRQHHQRQTFLRRQRELAQQIVDTAEAVVVGANGVNQTCRHLPDTAIPIRRDLVQRQQSVCDGCIVGCIGRDEVRDVGDGR